MNQTNKQTEDFSMKITKTMEQILNFADNFNSSKHADIHLLIFIQSFIQNISKSLFLNFNSSKFMFFYKIII